MEQNHQTQIASLQGEIEYIWELINTTLNEPAKTALMERLRGLMRAMAELIAAEDIQEVPQAAQGQPEGATSPTSPPPEISGEEPARPVQGTRRVFTPEELARYNGTDGYPAYVAVNGIVYNVSNLPIWQTGTHFGLHAGQDLSLEFNTCHSNRPFVLESMVPVGRMETEHDRLT